MIVYLAGPITGLSYSDATDWRVYAKDYLAECKVDTLNPLRHKDYLAGSKAIAASYERHPMSTSRGIMTRDYFDVSRCDLVLANLLGADTVSIGTVMELAWAYQRRIPTVVVCEDGNPHEHPMVLEAASYRVMTLAEGLEITARFLADEPPPRAKP